MDTESLVQPNRRLMFFETSEELQGHLHVPNLPEVSAGYADIYHGLWINPQGQQVEVAVKELKVLISRDRQTDQEELIRRRDIRMKREVYVWSQTKHPNLHPLLGYRSQPHPRIISLWCRHGNLTHYMTNNPDLSRLDKLRLIFQAACGLEHLHAQDPPICHADIKPENVLVKDNFQAALSDFGLSRVLDIFGHHSEFTTSESVKGTYNYIAPELFNEERQKSTLKTDVYAFGGLILTVMSGKPPFWGLKQPRIFARVTRGEPPSQEDHQNLPPCDRLWSLMRRCWSMAPEARPSMAEILKELWGEIAKEESGLWSRLGMPSFPRIDDDDCPNLDFDTLGERATAELPSLLDLDHVPAGGSVLSIHVAEEKCYPTSEETLGAAQRILETLRVGSRVIPVIKKYIGAAVDVGSCLVELARSIDRNESIANSIGSNALKLIGRLERLREDNTRHGEGLASLVTDVQRELRCIQENMKEWCSSGLLPDALSYCDDAKGLRRYKGDIQKMLEEIHLLVALNTDDLLAELRSTEMQMEHRRLRRCLGDGNHGVEGNAIEDITCLSGTRVDILEHIDNWIRGTSASERALWIRGMAGRGKSTIASTVSHHWRFRASCAIFHCRTGQDALNRRMICALARQLGDSLVSEVKNAVLETIRENEDIANEQPSEQFKTLLVASLGKLEGHPYPIIIIVDALDECHEVKDVVDFVRLIHRHSSSFPTNVRFLLTCRPEAALLRALEPNGWSKIDLDSASEVSDDIARYIYYACKQIRDGHDLPEGWPSPGDLARLVDMSQGLFQWAYTAITYVSNGSPVDRLRSLLQHQSMGSGLDDLYNQILSKAMDNVRQEPEKQQVLRSVLGTLATAPHPVSLEVVATLYGDSDIFGEMEQESIIQFLRKDILADLHSLLHIPNSAAKPMRFMHTSIRDLLVSRQRCQEQPYYIDTTHYHQQLAKHSLSLMLKLLKENACNLSDLSQASSEIQEVAAREISSALRYCCQAWSTHLTEGLLLQEEPNRDAVRELADFELFSKEKVLAWMEVMSLIGGTSEAITMAKKVHQWLLRCCSKISGSHSLINLWNDVNRFMTAFLEPISFGPLHIYASALPHCPRETELWRLYGSNAKVRILPDPRLLTWPSNLWIRSAVDCPRWIAFSVDGSLVITGTPGETIQFWDSETGKEVGGLLTDCSDEVQSGCISADGRALAMGYDEGTIRLWDLQTGMQLGEPLTGHSCPVFSVCFSPDDGILASGSGDKTVRLWDPQTGIQVGKPLDAHSGSVTSVCFSPDGRVLVSGSWDTTIGLWDPHTGKLLCEPLTGHSGPIWSVCFSPDGRVLASGSDDRTVRLWDPRAGRQLGKPLTGHSAYVYSVCFSPDGKVLASGSEDRTIRLWNPHTGTQMGEPLTSHNDGIWHMCFSRNGRLLASASTDETIGLWDPHTGGREAQPLYGHSQSISVVCFSPDGRVLASGSKGHIIRLWDPRTALTVGEPLIGHTSWVMSLCFSPGGQILASGSHDQTVRLWNSQNGRQVGEPLYAHSKTVTSLCFSPDGGLLASGSSDMTIRLWDPQTGRQVGRPLDGHSDVVTSLCFSPDGRALAVGSWDQKIRLWDPRVGIQLGELLTDITLHFLSFSPDGDVIVGRDILGGCIVWDTLTHQTYCSTPVLPSHVALGFQDQWITHSFSRLLWLPAEFRGPLGDWYMLPERMALHNKTLAFVHGASLFILDLSAS